MAGFAMIHINQIFNELQMALTRCLLTIGLMIVAPCAAIGKPTVVVVIGAPGEPEYAEQFREWSDRWRTAATKADADFKLIGDGDDSKISDREKLQELLAKESLEGSDPLWLILIGHGTFDGQNAKFNLRGQDLTAEDLGAWLDQCARPLALINCSAASAPFLNRLSRENRVIITATKSGVEQNFARFGQYLSAAIADARADIDKDGQVSLLEAYLTACRELEEYYKQEARLPTEHALLDDNGDKLGTPAAWFRGVRATQRAQEGAALDGTRAHQLHLIASDGEKSLSPEVRKRRDELELAVAKLREEKVNLKEEDYYARLEKLMIELARLYESSAQP
jgi:hypothetical protein